METDATRMCQLLVGLPTVTVLGVIDEQPDSPIVVVIETILETLERCSSCGTPARVKDRDPVALTDLPAFGRSARLVWRKRRWCCPDVGCAVGSWTETAPAIAAPRMKLTDRAGRWVTFQVGCHGRTVAEVAADLGADSHTANGPGDAPGSWVGGED